MEEKSYPPFICCNNSSVSLEHATDNGKLTMRVMIGQLPRRPETPGVRCAVGVKAGWVGDADLLAACAEPIVRGDKLGKPDWVV